MTASTLPRAALPIWTYALLALIAAALFLPGFTVLPPFDRDEARFAQASSQMLDSGNFVDIRFQDETRYKKPVGIYWLQSAATTLAEAARGVAAGSEKLIWTYRIPSFLGAILAVLVSAWTAARLFGAPAGFIAGLMMASCVVLGVEARMAKTDAVLLATVVIGQAVLAQLYLTRRDPAPAGRAAWTAPLLFWIAAGIGVLVKGPMVLLVSGSTALVLALWDREAGWLKRLKPLAGLGIVAAIAAPWLIAIAIKSKGAFFAESVGHDMLGKVSGGQEGKGLPPGYYLGTLWVTFAPWSLLALLAVPWTWARRRLDAVRFCIAWIVPSWLVFEAVPTKLLHYTLPVFPAIAALAAAALLDNFDRSRERPRRWLTAAAVALGVIGFGALTLAVAVIPWLVGQRIDPIAVSLVPAVGGLFALALHLLLRGERRTGLAAGVGAAALLYVGTYAAVLPNIDGIWVSRQATRAVAQVRPCADSVVASAGYSEPSLVFLLGTPTKLVHGAGAATHLLSDRACALALVEDREAAAFLDSLGTVTPLPLAELAGFNYNTGKRLHLTLYRLPAS
ncbi:glycosyltransferase family 39 protein [Azospirillum humicireducens]|uniref:Glycosyltransferase family 39 protein n=1 Tax=Azospirillum humicireducens TaxID=1226968 RepID=A0A160JI45_9PROT|nr:glycosyltransferase family 39 protein [Azospirillum humicireducens]ANC92779.1 glycosyltransferase family 39 protein [Azospirillum humicireducens]